MIAKINRTTMKGDVFAPPSKSYTHRAIAISALSKHAAVVDHPLISEDTKATIRAAVAFGTEVEIKEDSVHINGIGGDIRTPDNVIDVANSGTTLRIMCAVASLADGTTVLTGDSSIRKRPNQPLLDALNDLGAEAFSTRNNGLAPIVIRGKLKGGTTCIDGSVSSQFITGLLIATPYAERETEIIIKNELKSRPYVNITIEMLKSAGVTIDVDESPKLRFVVPPEQEIRFSGCTVPGDFSSASYFLAAGALCGEVTMHNMYPTEQGDSIMIDILRQMGADIAWDKNKGTVRVKSSELHGITVDSGETPDLVPTLAVLGAVSSGVTIIENVAHVRFKETDRLHAMTVELKKMGADIKEEKDRLIIKGGELKGASVHGWEDHRIVMALSIAGLVAGNTVIDTAESVAISYPGFFEDLARLGSEKDSVRVI